MKTTTFLLIALLYLATLGLRGLNDPDEGRYAEIAREMVASGDWFQPTLNGIPHFQKPPLLYWLTAASISAFGPYDWAARLPSALAALGLILGAAWLGRELRDRDTGHLAGFLCACMIGVYLLGHLLTPDMLMSALITVSLASLARFQNTRQRRWAWLFFVAAGLAFLAKGPMGFVIPASAAVGVIWALRREGNRLALPWVRGGLLALAIGLSWHIAMVCARPELREYFIGDELVKRVSSGSHGRSKPFYFFLLILPLLLLPWTGWLPLLARRAWRSRIDVARAFLLFGVTIPFVVLSLSGSKLPTYVLPLTPLFAVGFAWLFQSLNLRRPLILWLGGATMVGCAVAASIGDHFRDHLGANAPVKSLAGLLQQQPGFANSALFSCKLRAKSFEFYLRREICATQGDSDVVLPLDAEESARLFQNPAELELAMRQRPLAYGLVRSRIFQQVFEKNGWRKLGRSGDFLLVAHGKL